VAVAPSHKQASKKQIKNLLYDYGFGYGNRLVAIRRYGLPEDGRVPVPSSKRPRWS